MKYKVIGWTNYENYEIPFSNKTIGFAERNAIIDEIKKHKYLFSGWDHQESWDNTVPILNDGKKRGFSQRGWGGVMAEAYDYMGDYDYAAFTFYESINRNKVKTPLEEFDPYNCPELSLENEHFEIEIDPELFAFAKNNNPFYLEDEDSLRYIDENDTITIKSNGEKLTFKVKSINRNKKEIKFKLHHLIKGKYKIILEFKSFDEKTISRKPMLILRENVKTLFNDCCKNYNFYVLYELFNAYSLEEVTNNSKSKKVINTLKMFVEELMQYSSETGLIISLLNFIDDYDFYKKNAYQSLDNDSSLLISLVNHYINKDINIDEDILECVKYISRHDYNTFSIYFKAIELKPKNKSLRKKLYSSSGYFRRDLGFLTMIDAGLEKYLKKEDKCLVDLKNYTQMKSGDIQRFAELYGYDGDKEKFKKYPYHKPSFIKYSDKCIVGGLSKYQEYVNSLPNDLVEEVLLYGIGMELNGSDECYDGYKNSAIYIYSLDLLTNFKYNLKETVVNKYKDKYPELLEYLDNAYDD